jgi:hypothetical protein
MTNKEALAELTVGWRSAADGVLDVARVAAPLAAGDVDGLALAVADEGQAPAEEVVDQRVDALLSRSDELLEAIGENADTIPVLLAAQEVGNALLVSSQDRQEALTALGTDADGGVSLAGPAQALDEFQAAVLGQAAPTPVPLPPALAGKLDSLQDAAEKELLALGKDVVLQGVLGTAVAGLVSLGGSKVEHAFDWVKKQVNFIRRAAVRILNWVVDKFKDLVPAAYREKIDAAIQFAIEKLKGGVETGLSTMLGKLLGREDVVRAWQKAMDADMDLTTAMSKLETVTAGHIKRIGYVTTGRKAVAGAGAVLKIVLSSNALPVQLVLGALVVALAGFVCWQVRDGFNDIECLVAGDV